MDMMMMNNIWGGVQIMIALMMEAARTSEPSVDNYFTRLYSPEDKSELYMLCV
jgi:hypothetical protein